MGTLFNPKFHSVGGLAGFVVKQNMLKECAEGANMKGIQMCFPGTSLFCIEQELT